MHTVDVISERDKVCDKVMVLYSKCLRLNWSGLDFLGKVMVIKRVLPKNLPHYASNYIDGYVQALYDQLIKRSGV